MSRIAAIDLLFHWPPLGGSVVDLKEILERLARQHDITLFVPELDGAFPRGRIDEALPFAVRKIPFNSLSFNSPCVVRRFRRALAEYAPDHVFVGDGWFMKFPLVCGLASYRPILRLYAYEGLCMRAPGTMYRRGTCNRSALDQFVRCTLCAGAWMRRGWSAPLQEFLATAAFSPFYRRTLRRAFACASTVLVYNDMAADLVRPHNPSVRVVPSGVDLERFRPAPAPENARPIVFMPGRAEYVLKGYDVFREACELLTAQGVELEAWVTSPSMPEGRDGAFRCLGWIAPKDMPEHYRAADIVVVPSIWPEAFGIVAAEAMACGRPVVASRVGGLQYVVGDDDTTGLLVPPEDPTALADALRRLLTDAGARGRMGRAAHAKAVRAYDWDHIVETHYEPLFS